MPRTVEASDGRRSYRFRCRSTIEVWRAESLLVKEAGTVAWIHEAVRENDVFCDIGANIGLYTLLAAERVGPRGHVYAFEPHVGNFESLLHNISLNGFHDRAHPMNCALHDREGVFDFNYFDWTPGSSMSQLDSLKDGGERAFRPVVRESKIAVTLDKLVRDGFVRQPDHVKIDVDGNELLILRGMREILTGNAPPRTLQVEVNARYKNELFALLREFGYEMYRRHDTQRGQAKISSGTDPDVVAHNVLFRPVLDRSSR